VTSSRTRRPFVAHPRHPLTGKQIRVSAPTPRKLEQRLAYLDDLREARRLGTRSDEEIAKDLEHLGKSPDRTLGRAARAYMERSTLAPNTRSTVSRLLSTHLRELAPMNLYALDARRLGKWIDKLRPQLTVSTIGVVWRMLRAIVRHAAEKGWIDHVPWGLWRPTLRAGDVGPSPRPPREAARDPRELRALLEAADKHDAERASSWEPNAREPVACLAAKIAAAAMLGLRKRELGGLEWHDVDAGAELVSIVRQADGRPTKHRRVDVVRALPELFARLEQHRARLEARGMYAPGGPVFPCPWKSEPGAPAHFPADAEVLTIYEFRAVVVRAGLPHPERWSPHSLRDSFVTLENEGAAGDLAAVRERSRHASIGSLVRYLRARSREPAAPRMVLPPAAPSPPALPPAPPPSSSRPVGRGGRRRP
jgi:integrase